MPRIPLAQLSGAVGRPAAPVLASGPSVRIDVRGLAADAEAPRINAGALGDFSGLANLAAGVGAVAGDFLAIEQKRRELDTKNRLADLENQARDAQVEFAKWQAANPDENKWGEEYKTRFEGFRARALEQAPEWASEHIRRELDRMGSIGAAQVAGDALRQTKDRFQETWRTRYKAAENVGDIDGMHALIDEGARDGIVWPEQTEALKGLATERGTEIQDQRARQAAAEAKRAAIDAVMNQAAQSDPRDVMAALEDERLFPALDPSDRAAVRADLRTMHRQQQMERIGSAWNDIAEGKIKTQADVAALEGIDAVEKEQMMGSLAKRADAAEQARLSDPKVQDAIFADALMRAQEWNKNQPDALVAYREIHQIADQLPAYLRGDVTEIIERKRREAPPSPDEEVLKYAASVTREMHDLELFAKWKTVDANGKPGVDFAKKDESLRTYSRVNRSINDFLKKNPNADEFAVKEQIGRIIGQSADAETVRQMLEETMLQTLTNEPPAPPAEPLGTVNEADGLPSGAGGIGAGAEDLLIPR